MSQVHYFIIDLNKSASLSGTEKQKIYGYDSLRFMAASIVVFSHIEIVKHYRGLPALVSKAVIYETGKLAVAAFFALSGFLITLLLLKEKDRTGNIRLGNFYLRRGLRIWPLYYLVLLLVFFVLPHFQIFYLPSQSEELQQHFSVKFILSLLLMPQMLFVKYMPAPGAGQFWTIGAEEIFYFLWPLLLRRTKNEFKLAVTVIAIFTITKMVLYKFSGVFATTDVHGYLLKAYLVLYYNRIDCILLGAVAAILFTRNNSVWIKYISDKRIAWAMALFVPVLYVCGINLGGIDYFIYSLCFAWLVSFIAVSQNEKPFRLLNFTERIGKITYGIYLWHFIMVFIAFAVLNYFFDVADRNSLAANILLYVTAYLLTYTVAIGSYKVLEKPFLKLKGKFRT